MLTNSGLHYISYSLPMAGPPLLLSRPPDRPTRPEARGPSRMGPPIGTVRWLDGWLAGLEPDGGLQA